jgi:hypothetical protein
MPKRTDEQDTQWRRRRMGRQDMPAYDESLRFTTPNRKILVKYIMSLK